MAENTLGRQMRSGQALNVGGVRSSTNAYLNYRKKVQNRLAEISNTVSDMIKESCSGIDSICNRVRECLNQMDTTERPGHLTEHLTEYEIQEEILESNDDTTEDNQTTVISVKRKQATNNIKQRFNYVGGSPRYELEEDRTKSMEDITQDNDETDISTIENIREEVNTNLEERVSESKLLKPFFTVINFGDKGESSSEILQQLSKINTECNVDRRNLHIFGETIVRDNYDIMNTIVDNIHEKIKNFSEATIQGKKTSEENKQRNEITRRLSEPSAPPKQKRIKRLLKSNSRQKSVQADDFYEETEMDYALLYKQKSKSFILPDVYRKRGTTNLYKKLIAQLEANDSFIFFQKLMNRRRKFMKNSDKKGIFRSQSKLLNIPAMNFSYPKRSISSSSSNVSSKNYNLNKKYADSLWFSQNKVIREKNKSGKKHKKKSKQPGSQRSLKGQISLSKQERAKNQQRKIQQDGSDLLGRPTFGSLKNMHTKVCPIECTCKMVVQNDLPPTPTSKCRLHWMRAKTTQAPHKKLAFLDILDDLTNRDLLPIQSEYPRKDNQKPRKLADDKDIQDTYLYKLMYGKQVTPDAWKQLLEPSVECLKKDCKHCQASIPGSADSSVSARLNMKENKSNSNALSQSNTKYLSKVEVAKKLSAYMHDPDKKQNFFQTVTVMPVQVYYDHYKPAEPPLKLKNSKTFSMTPKKPPQSIMKEAKGFKRAEWSPAGLSKPMKVVYDILPKKSDPPPLAPFRKPVVSSARTTEKTLATEKTTPKKFISKSFSPKNFDSFVHNAEPPNAKKETTSYVEAREKCLAKYKRIQSDIEKIKSEVHGKILTSDERRIWSNKYGKSVGQQLVSFIEHQEPLEMPPVPKYASPKLPQPTIPENKTVVSPEKAAVPQKQVLNNLQGLKQKNAVIQNNIQKAISVIETKMMDMLTAESSSVDAFDVMEKEITHVLSMMKCNKRSPKKHPPRHPEIKGGAKPDTSLEDEFNSISDQLFLKLQRILDSEKSTDNYTASGTDTSTKNKNASTQSPREAESRKKQKPMSSRRDSVRSAEPKPASGTDTSDKSRHVPRESPKKEEVRKKQKSMSARNNKADTKTDLSSVTSMSADESVRVRSCSPPRNNVKKVEKKKIKFEKKSKLPTTPPKLLTEPTPCGDQNVVRNPTKISNSKKPASREKKPAEGKGKVENSEGDFENKPSSNTVEKLNNEEVEREENPTKEEASLDTSQIGPTTIEGSSKEEDNVPSLPLPESSPKDVEIKKDASAGSFSDEVHKIIKRVEDIYTQLDDMQNTEDPYVPKLKEETQLADVNSEMFLTPFMQAVKEKRSNPDPAKNLSMQKTPSYFNVISFLDTLSNIQSEKPFEVHTARLCYHVNVYHQPLVCHNASIQHVAEFTSNISEKPSCLKKCEVTKSKHKKVSFLVLKEDKSSQATLCPLHMNKDLKVSSQQFPPLEQEQVDDATEEDKVQTDAASSQPDHNKDIIVLCNRIKKAPEEIAEYDDNAPAGVDYATNNTDETQNATPNHVATSRGGRGRTKNLDLSKIDDKSTQMYCHAQTEVRDELDNKKEKRDNSSSVIEPIQDIFDDIQESLNKSWWEATKILDMSIGDKSTQVFTISPKDAGIAFKEGETQAQSKEEKVSEDTETMETSKSIENDTFDTPVSVFYNQVITNAPTENKICNGVYDEKKLPHTKSFLQNLNKPKIAVFRDTPGLLDPLKDLNIKLYKQKLEKRKELRLARKSSLDLVNKRIQEYVPSDRDNVVLLKSFYAIVYILMFTALSLDYRCV